MKWIESIKVFTCLSGVILIMASCAPGDSGSGSGTSSDPWPVILVENDISTDTTWESGNVYLINTWNFDVEGCTLTIEPDVIVKFHPANGPWLTVSSGGRIVSQGEAAAHVVFTSYYDDIHGGDTNGDASATSPDVEDWGIVYLDGVDDCSFEYSDFLYSGDSSYYSALYIYGDNTSLDHCSFINNTGSEYYEIGALDASNAGSGTSITNCLFYNNSVPLSISDQFSLAGTNSFHRPDITSQTNEYNGIFVNTIDHVTSDIIWEEDEVAYVIDDVDWWITSGASLTLGDNVVLKFESGSMLDFADGTSQLINHSGTGVAFTSYRDDSRKGDTNGDGSASSPASSDWYGICSSTQYTTFPYTVGWSNIYYSQY